MQIETDQIKAVTVQMPGGSLSYERVGKSTVVYNDREDSKVEEIKVKALGESGTLEVVFMDKEGIPIKSIYSSNVTVYYR